MDDKIHQMITKDIETTEIIIKRQSKIRENSNRLLISIFDQSFQKIQGELSDLDIRVVIDIDLVIKMEGDVKSIGIGQQRQPGNQSDGNEMMEGEGSLFLWRC